MFQQQCSPVWWSSDHHLLPSSFVLLMAAGRCWQESPMVSLLPTLRSLISCPFLRLEVSFCACQPPILRSIRFGNTAHCSVLQQRSFHLMWRVQGNYSSPWGPLQPQFVPLHNNKVIRNIKHGLLKSRGGQNMAQWPDLTCQLTESSPWVNVC